MAVNQRQVKKYMSARKNGLTQEVAAAKAGISTRTGRRLERRNESALQPQTRMWRTREDPFQQVWESDLVPLLEKDSSLMAVTLLEEVQSKYPEQYPDSLLRTLQRRIKSWRAKYGPDQDIVFRQVHKPGMRGLSDFTQLKGVEIRIDNKPFIHLLYHFRLAYSYWSYLRVVQGGESFTALAEGLQEALLRLGGAPNEHRTDSLSAAYKNLDKQAQADLTARYDALCKHYGMQPSRNNPGKGHENGSVESAHGHLKRRIVQALKLRGNADFDNVAQYQAFIDEQVARHNKRNQRLIDEERSYLTALPQMRAVDYDELLVRVTSTSTISVKRVTYSVPSRLIGEQLRVRCYDDRLACFLGSESLFDLPRIRVRKGEPRAHYIDYRHMISALERKPMAFYNAKLRDHILPNDYWRELWRSMCSTLPPRQACYLIIQGLKIAGQRDDLEGVGNTLRRLIREHPSPSPLLLERYLKVPVPDLPTQEVTQHQLDDYDALLGKVRGYEHE